MSWAKVPKIDDLRMTYNVAAAVEKISALAVQKPRLRGEAPSQNAKTVAARAQNGLTQARDQLLAAITEHWLLWFDRRTMSHAAHHAETGFRTRPAEMGEDVVGSERQRNMRDLGTAERHVSHGVRLVERQRAAVEELRRDGHNVDLATRLLVVMEETLRLQVGDRDRLRRQCDGYAR